MSALSEVRLGYGEKLILVILAVYLIFHFFPFYTAITISTVLIGSIYGWMHYKFSHFKRLGISGPPVDNYFMGNMATIKKRGVHTSDSEWMETYGKVYGTFLMNQPELVISDMDLLKRVLVKDFASFTNRRTFDRGESKALLNKILTVLKDQRWKDVRNTITPVFTSSKIKNMVPLMEDCGKEAVDVMNAKIETSNSVDSKKFFGNLTMDTICRVAFGFQTDCQQDAPGKMEHDLIKNCRVLFEAGFNWKIIFIILFSETNYWLARFTGIRVFFGPEEDYFRKVLTPAIQDRRQNDLKSRNDFLQVLVRCLADEGEVEVDSLISSPHVGGKRVPLSTDDILAQSFLFLLAGYDTTASTLNFMFYELALNQDIQEKCLQEIHNVLSEGEPMTYDSLTRLPYVEAVMYETLRKYPPAPRIDRACTNDIDLDGIPIHKGDIVAVPVYAIHHSPEYYPQPEQFDPKRFLGESKTNRNPLTFLPFGYGPRNCIGMRLAQMEIKITVAYVLQNFRVYPTDQTEDPPLKLNPVGLLRPLNPIIMGFERR